MGRHSIVGEAGGHIVEGRQLAIRGKHLGGETGPVLGLAGCLPALPVEVDELIDEADATWAGQLDECELDEGVGLPLVEVALFVQEVSCVYFHVEIAEKPPQLSGAPDVLGAVGGQAGQQFLRVVVGQQGRVEVRQVAFAGLMLDEVVQVYGPGPILLRWGWRG